MRILLAAVLIASFAAMPPAKGQLMNSGWPKWGVDAQNRHKVNLAGPSNPSLLVRWVGLGGTEEASWDGSYFWTPQGPQLRAYDPTMGQAYDVMNTTPGNTSAATQLKLIFNIHDTEGLDPPRWCDDEVNSGNCASPEWVASAWSGYGRNYIYFPDPFSIGSIVLYEVGGAWRSQAPTANTTQTVPLKDEDTPVTVTGIIWTSISGTVYWRYVHCEWRNPEDYVFSLRVPKPWSDAGISSLGTGTTMFSPVSAALASNNNTLYMVGHYGVVTAVNLTMASVAWQRGFDESFDGPVVVLANGDLLWASSINPETGRKGNVLYKLPSTGVGNPTRLTFANGSIVGGPAYNSSNNRAYVVTLGDGVSGIHAVNTTNMTLIASRTDIGQLRTHPVIDSAGNIYIGNEQGFLYSLDSNLNTRANYPIFVGGPISTPVTIAQPQGAPSPLLLVSTGNSVSVYRNAPGGPSPGFGFRMPGNPSGR
ncbi:MAG: hypothetical protein AMXMBFR61_06200 [Fimbriimonadales bacterium]